MGKSYSRNVENEGNPQVSIINALEEHGNYHNEHELKLWAIIVMLGILLGINMHTLYASRRRKQAVRSARSLARVDDV